MNYWLLVFFFFLVAMIYASVGFGGGSSYLALLSVAAVSFEVLRPTALLCNVVVVAGGAYLFYRRGMVPWRDMLRIILVSVPFAFLGGYWRLPAGVFFLLLAFTLLCAGVALWWQPAANGGRRYPEYILPAVSAAIGFLSGLVGIGGGIFLAPVLHFMRWQQAHVIAATACFFILANSMSGLAGQLAHATNIEWGFVLPLLIAVFAGGQVGSRMGIQLFQPLWVRRVTAVLVFAAGLNLLTDYL
jgi:hypothetical protein